MKPADVDEYIANFPKELRSKLKELREAIKAAAPEAKETISYGMPYYGYKGRLVYFRLNKNHIGLYALINPIKEYKGELKGHITGKGTIQFALDEKLPLDLIKKLIKAQVKRNDESAKNK